MPKTGTLRDYLDSDAAVAALKSASGLDPQLSTTPQAMRDFWPLWFPQARQPHQAVQWIMRRFTTVV